MNYEYLGGNKWDVDSKSLKASPITFNWIVCVEGGPIGPEIAEAFIPEL